LASHTPLFPFLSLHLGKLLPAPSSCTLPADPHLYPCSPHVSWRWGVTHQAPVGSQGWRPDGRGSVGRRGH
jgi:hypothetical protein